MRKLFVKVVKNNLLKKIFTIILALLNFLKSGGIVNFTKTDVKTYFKYNNFKNIKNHVTLKMLVVQMINVLKPL